MKKIPDILFIDDDEISCYVSSIVVEDMKVADRVICLHDDQEALQFIQDRCSNKSAAEDQCPALIFLDLNLPLFNGFEFLEKLQTFPGIAMEKLFIVLLTSSWHSRDMKKAEGYPVEGYLLKPLTRGKVEDVMNRYHHRLQRIA